MDGWRVSLTFTLGPIVEHENVPEEWLKVVVGFFSGNQINSSLVGWLDGCLNACLFARDGYAFEERFNLEFFGDNQLPWLVHKNKTIMNCARIESITGGCPCFHDRNLSTAFGHS